MDAWNLALAVGRPDMGMVIHDYFVEEDIKKRPRRAPQEEAHVNAGEEAVFLLVLAIFLVFFGVVLCIMMQGLLAVFRECPSEREQ